MPVSRPTGQRGGACEALINHKGCSNRISGMGMGSSWNSLEFSSILFVQKATTRRFVCLQVFPQCLCKTSIATSFTPPYLPSNDIKTRHRSSTRTLRMTVTLPHAMPVGTGRIRFPYHRLPDAEVVKLLTPHSAQKPCRAFSKWFAISFHAAQI